MSQRYPLGVLVDKGSRAVGATIVDVVYGIQVVGEQNRHIKLAENLAQIVAAALLPGAYLVDLIPLRAHFTITATLRVLTYMSSKTRTRMVSRGGVSEFRRIRATDHGRVARGADARG